MTRITLTIALLAAAVSTVALFPRGSEAVPFPEPLPDTCWAMFWNVQNLFDLTDDPEIEGKDVMDPVDQAEKIRRLRAVIGRVNWGLGPDMLGLAEVENAALVKKLVDGGYRVLFDKGGYRRGINVALATRLPVEGEPEHLDPGTTGRTVLHAKVLMRGGALHVFVLHNKSKFNRATATLETRTDEEMRVREARFLRKRLDALFRAEAGANVLIMGDFNEHYRDSLFRQEYLARPYGRGEKRPAADDDDHRLLNLGPALEQSFPQGGTSYFHPKWDVFDNFLVSEALVLPGGLYVSPKDAFIGVSWDLLSTYGTPLGFRRGIPCGVSDHLPVLMRIRGK